MGSKKRQIPQKWAGRSGSTILDKKSLHPNKKCRQSLVRCQKSTLASIENKTMQRSRVNFLASPIPYPQLPAATPTKASTDSDLIWALPTSYFSRSKLCIKWWLVRLPPRMWNHWELPFSLLRALSSPCNLKNSLPSTPSDVDSSRYTPSHLA